jgi:hypothetical protein
MTHKCTLQFRILYGLRREGRSSKPVCFTRMRQHYRVPHGHSGVQNQDHVYTITNHSDLSRLPWSRPKEAVCPRKEQNGSEVKNKHWTTHVWWEDGGGRGLPCITSDRARRRCYTTTPLYSHRVVNIWDTQVYSLMAEVFYCAWLLPSSCFFIKIQNVSETGSASIIRQNTKLWNLLCLVHWIGLYIRTRITSTTGLSSIKKKREKRFPWRHHENI